MSGAAASPRVSCSRADMARYAFGECAVSLVMNSIFGFAMLYYTDALGLSASLVGIAMSVATLWDAVVDPVMGRITDVTRSRFGRRHPYLVIGALCTTATFLALWFVPEIVRENSGLLFAYLIAVNVLQRTAISIFIIPYVALGFELCPDYQEQAALQGWRTALGMAANLCGPALAWTLFFGDNAASRATRDATNYEQMGSVFAAVGLVFMLSVAYSTRHHIVDTRGLARSGRWLRDFLRSFAAIGHDRLARTVLLFTFTVFFGAATVSVLQMYVFEHVLQLGGFDKTLAHGGTMAGAAIGALLSGRLTAKFEKRGALMLAAGMSFGCAVTLAVLFAARGIEGPIAPFTGGGGLGAFVVFVGLHGLYWIGNGVVIPVSTSMIADTAECARRRQGAAQQGSFAALHSFAFTAGTSAAMLAAGVVLDLIGFEAGASEVQRPEVRVALPTAAFLLGPSISLAALLLIRRYPIDRAFLARLREKRDPPEEDAPLMRVAP